MDATAIGKAVGIAVYLAALLTFGALAARRMKTVGDYYAGGKRFRFWAAAFSARATGESAWLLLGLTGLGAAVGVHAFWAVFGETLGVGLAWLAMCRRFKRLTTRYDAITVPDYLEGRFRDRSHRLRIAAAAALVVFVTIYVSAQIDATGQAFEQFLGLNYYAGALIGFGVVMTYITSGGFVAVVWSDIFQGVLMFVGLVTLPIAGLVSAGGLGPVLEGLGRLDPALLELSGNLDAATAAALRPFSWIPGPSLEAGWTPTAVFGAMGLASIGLGFLGSPQVFVRFLSIRDEGEIPPGAAVALVFTFVGDAGAVLTGMVGRYLLTGPGQGVEAVLGSGAEDVLPSLVGHVLPAVLVGGFIAMVLSAIMSTVDSLLVVASSAAVRDWYQQVRHPDLRDDQLVPLSRRVTVALALVALTIAITVALVVPGRTVFWFVIFGFSGIAATFCPTIILSLFWSGLTTRGALVAMATGFAAVPFFRFAAPSLPLLGAWFHELGEMAPSFLASGLAGIVASVLDPAREGAVDVRAELAPRSTDDTEAGVAPRG